MPTKSEKMFVAFCKDNGIKAKKIPESKVRTPDYETRIGDHLVIVEVKQLDPKKEELQEIVEAAQGKGIAHFPKNRISKKLSNISKQVKRYAKEHIPTIVLLYNNVPCHDDYLSDGIILDAMYGEETNDAYFKNGNLEYIAPSRHGPNQSFTRNHNTSVSALAVMERDNKGKWLIKIFHNKFADVKLDPKIWASLPVEQYIYKENTTDDFGTWQGI